MQPEQIKIAITRKDGSLAIMGFITKEYRSSDGPGWERNPTRGNIEAEIKKLGIPTKSWRIITDNQIPTDRYFRNAWTDSLFGIKVDIAKAKEIHKQNLRILRASLLEDLDVAYMRADEAGDNKLKAKIISQKQVLRDITNHPDFKKARTPEQIKAIKIIV
jgi:hypothetical protein